MKKFKIWIKGEEAFVRKQLENGDLGGDLKFESQEEGEQFLKSNQTDIDITCFDLEIVKEIC